MATLKSIIFIIWTIRIFMHRKVTYMVFFKLITTFNNKYKRDRKENGNATTIVPLFCKPHLE